jgi:hypothetical protein
MASDPLKVQFDITFKNIEEELTKFFRPLDGFKWEFSDGSLKEIKRLPDNLEWDIDKVDFQKIKEERLVCIQLVYIYKKNLKERIKDQDFKNKVEKFVIDKKIDQGEVGKDVYGPFLKEWDLLIGKNGEEGICDDVLKYYYLKYRIISLLKEIRNDPYQKDYIELINQSNWKSINDKERAKVLNKINNSRNKVRDKINRILIEVEAKDGISYPKLLEIYNSLTGLNLEEYCTDLTNAEELQFIVKNYSKDLLNTLNVDFYLNQKVPDCQGKKLKDKRQKYKEKKNSLQAPVPPSRGKSLASLPEIILPNEIKKK